jgi:hypothetical protein
MTLSGNGGNYYGYYSNGNTSIVHVFGGTRQIKKGAAETTTYTAVKEGTIEGYKVIQGVICYA